jgi:prenyl protein peptidase
MAAFVSCAGIATVYVASLYLLRTPPSRNHPVTIRRRAAAVAIVSALAWLPAALSVRTAAAVRSHVHGELPPLIALLGLSGGAIHVARVTASATALVAVLYAGPLLWWATAEQQNTLRERLAARLCGIPGLIVTRDCVIAPLAEEWCFRACMVPLLWLKVGVSTSFVACSAAAAAVVAAAAAVAAAAT